ncbi:hypothetical protein Ddc_20160 [Ditylenchus destructor]|nr:hypothetical protein Ddc_20160 [Ditylenchus destructor]
MAWRTMARKASATVLGGMSASLILMMLSALVWARRLGEACDASSSVEPGMRVALFRKGFMVGIGNPKVLLFFGSLFPQFIDASRSSTAAPRSAA